MNRQLHSKLAISFVLCAVVNLLSACSSAGGSGVNAPTSIANHRVHSDASVFGIRFHNGESNQTENIYLDGYTLGSCPWVESYNSYASEIGPGFWWPSESGIPDYLAYSTTCSPWNEPAVWTVSYGTDPHDASTVCAFTANYTADAGIAFGVSNGSGTDCTATFDSSDGPSGAEHFTYVAVGSALIRHHSALRRQ